MAASHDGIDTPSRRTLLWALLGGAVVWAAHLLSTYTLVAYACATGWLGGARTALVVMSAVAVVLIAWSAIVARGQWRAMAPTTAPGNDTWDARLGERTARVRFLMMVGLFSAGVFAIGVVYEAVTIWFVPLCEAGVSG